jgi:hypothetical protein
MIKTPSIHALATTISLLVYSLQLPIVEGLSLPRMNARMANSCAITSALHLSQQDSEVPVVSLSSPFSRRTAFLQSSFVLTSLLSCPTTSHAKSTSSQAIPPEEDVSLIQQAASALTSLLDNWDRATIDCTYADVPRELLESKNKEQLLEKASTFALFDKSTSVVSCKKTNKIVRDYIGVTGKGPCVNIEKRMLRRTVVDSFVDPDDLEDYYSQVEVFSQAISRASSLSYAAGSADFDSMNNFAKGERGSSAGGSTNGGETDNSNLEQARKAIVEAKTCIDRIVSLLSTDGKDQ